METTIPVDKRWILCTFASFLGCSILVICLNHRHGIVATTMTMTATTTAAIEALSISNMKSSMPQGLQMNRTARKCNIFEGNWVYDPKTYPVYEVSQCPFLSDQVSCRRNGRPDFEYEKWRWEAKDCEIPRFNGTDMLERLRGKRVIIVGDSLNRNQWESLSCLLYSSIPSSRAYVNVRSSRYKVFKAKDYNCSIEFYWSPFLLELDETRGTGNRILKLDKLPASSQQWRGADIMVFNTGHWWVHRGKLRAWDFFQHKGRLMENLEVEAAFEIAMKSWAHWIDRYVNPAKTTVFFRSISPEHKGKQWCYNQTQPIMDESYAQSFPREITTIMKKTAEEMRIQVNYMNITNLSQYRKDAHSSVYTVKQGKLLTEEQRQKPEFFADCSHWCLPGLPDTWNMMLYALLVLDTSQIVLQ